MIQKKLGPRIRSSSDGECQNLRHSSSEPAIHCNIIDFEAGKEGHGSWLKPKRQRWHGARESRQLPNLAAEDWFEWTAL